MLALSDVVFFFQAEDGIRDKLVTGVQTCALPIWGGGWGGSTDPQGEVSNAAEAFAILGLEEGSSYTAVMKAFRKRAKELHPDVRAGDRSGEVQLRKLIAAYQYIKSIYNWGEDTPSPSRGA